MTSSGTDHHGADETFIVVEGDLRIVQHEPCAEREVKLLR